MPLKQENYSDLMIGIDGSPESGMQLTAYLPEDLSRAGYRWAFKSLNDVLYYADLMEKALEESKEIDEDY